MFGESKIESLPSRLAQIMADAYAFSGEFRERYPTSDPEPDSQAFQEMHNNGISGPVGPWKPSDVYQAYSLAVGILTPAAGQYLCALSQLYQEPMALYGFQVVARALAEAAAQSWWLLVPDISVEVRMARVFTQRWTNIEELRKADVIVGADPADATARMIKLRAEAAELGVEEQFSKPKDHSRQPEFLGFKSGMSQGSTQLVRQYFEALGSPVGELWYRGMSAICHGTAWGLLQYFESAPTSDPTRARLTPALMPEAVVQVAVWAVEFYLGAIQYHAALFGWDAEAVAARRKSDRMAMLGMLGSQGRST
jgi:hypothetical protein